MLHVSWKLIDLQTNKRKELRGIDIITVDSYY